MEKTFDASLWIGTTLQSPWLLALMPLSLSFFILILVWRRRRATTTLLQAISLMSQATGILIYHCSRQQLAQELARARRYQRPLAVVVLSLERDEFVERPHSLFTARGNGSATSHKQNALFLTLTFFAIGSLFYKALRESDVVTYDATNNQYIILLVESTVSQARQAARRMQELVYQKTLIHLQARVAEFPADGLTIEDLVSAAQAAYAPQLLDNGAVASPGEPRA